MRRRRALPLKMLQLYKNKPSYSSEKKRYNGNIPKDIMVAVAPAGFWIRCQNLTKLPSNSRI